MFLPTSKTAFLDCLARSGLRAPDGKAWSSRSVNAVLEELPGQGLLTEDLACSPTLLHPVAVDAAASADGELLERTAGIRDVCSRSGGRTLLRRVGWWC